MESHDCDECGHSAGQQGHDGRRASEIQQPMNGMKPQMVVMIMKDRESLAKLPGASTTGARFSFTTAKMVGKLRCINAHEPDQREQEYPAGAHVHGAAQQFEGGVDHGPQVGWLDDGAYLILSNAEGVVEENPQIVTALGDLGCKLLQQPCQLDG